MDALGTNVIAKGWTSFAVGLVVLFLPGIGHAAEAGKFEFLMGDVKVISATGLEHVPVQGENFNEGDTVVSKEARVQLRFTDGAFISLAPHSRFHIKEYTYNGVADGAEKVTMELLRGALRTITGLIGKKNKAAYLMQTTVATIGIRGTEYSISYVDGITGTVSGGAIAVCNAGGCLDVIKDQSYYVRDDATKPVLTEKAVFLPPPQPTREGTAIASAQNDATEDTDTLSGSGGDVGKNKAKSLKGDAKDKGKGSRKSDGELLTSELSEGQDKAKDKKEKAPKAENGQAELASSKKQSPDGLMATSLDKVSEGGAKGKGANNPGLDKKELTTADFALFTNIGADFRSKSSDSQVDSLGNGATGKLDKGAGNSVDKPSQSPGHADTNALSASLDNIGLAGILDGIGKDKKIKLDDPIFGVVGKGKKLK